MKAGDLRSRITLQASSTVQDETGQMMPGVWTDLATVSASVKHQSGLSAIKSGMDVSSVKASIRIRHRTGIHAGMRVLHRGEIYSIEAVMPDEQRVFLDIVASVKNAET